MAVKKLQVIGMKGDPGDPGPAGKNGADGVGISSIEQTQESSEDGGLNVFKITLTNGQTAEFSIRNGKQGSPGKDGNPGSDGAPGKDGSPGADGEPGEDGTDGGYYQPSIDTAGNITWTPSKAGMPAVAGANIKGPAGDPGKDGDDGAPGKDGYTPVKGKDYFDGKDGKDGEDGEPGPAGSPGADGVGILKIEQTTTSSTDGGSNVFTVTLTNGNTATFTVKNGSKGNPGKDGDQGPQGPAGSDATVTSAKIKEVLGYTPADQTKVSQLEGQIADQQTQINNKQPKGDYALKSEIPDVDGKLTALEIKLGQQHLTFAEGDTVDEALVWLEENGDTSKVYVLPDGFFYEYTETIVETGGVAYTNHLPLAIDTDGSIYGEDYNGDGVNDGYKKSTRLSGSSGNPSSATELMCASGFMRASDGGKIRIKCMTPVTGTSAYVITYNESKTRLNNGEFAQTSSDWSDTSKQETWCTYEDGVLTITLDTSKFGTGIAFFRVSGHMDENTIITINEEIKEGSGTAIVEKWVSTGQALVPTNYDGAIGQLVQTTNAQTEAIKELQESIKNGTSSDGTDALTLIRNWDKPIYERLTPFLLSEDLNITKYPQHYTESQDPDRTYRKANVQGVYDEYNALCTAHPDFVRDITNTAHGLEGATETTFGGLCSDGEQYVRVYEFCEREGRHSNTTDADYWSETKPTFIIVTGIHWEYNGVYSMLNALKLITENPELRDMRRNCRFIVIPMSNPYCFTTYNNSGGGHYNANGVEIHNNFYVDFNNAIDSTHGTAPLTEVETRYIDNAMRKYADTGVCLLTCHSNATKGSNFIWGSVATKFMCNVSMRLVDLMSYAWDSKYDNYRTAIDEQKVGNSNPQEDGDYRCGFASLSTSSGTETKQALWYGMQGINVEVYEKFYLFDPDGTDVSLAVSRGAEVYVNLLRLLAVTYDHNDRDKYAPVPAYKTES